MATHVKADSANDAWEKCIQKLLAEETYNEKSRNGNCRFLNHCLVTISDSINRIISYRVPPMSIAFSLAEIVWILHGSNDAKVLNYFNPILPKFSGYEDFYHGAYGYRLRNDGLDQIYIAFEALKNNPNSRQVVLGIWNTESDLPKLAGVPNNPDIPCNVLSMLKIVNNKLFWSQIMRSNDIYRGFPYNIMQFTIIHELFCRWLDLDLGEYSVYINNLHLYDEDIQRFSSNFQRKSEGFKIDPITYQETNRVVNEIYERMYFASRNCSLSKEEIKTLFSYDTGNVFFSDILTILGCYIALKYQYSELSQFFLERIQIVELKESMEIWITYRNKKAKEE